MAERVPRIRRTCGAPDAQQQKKLVAAIHRRVDRLAEHRCTACRGSGDEFRGGDEKIAAQCGINHGLRGGARHPPRGSWRRIALRVG